MRVVAFIHVPRSTLGAVGLGYARIQAALEARGHTLTVLTPEDFPGVLRWPARTHVLLFPMAAALWAWRRAARLDLIVFHSYAGWIFNLWKRGVPTITAFHGLEPLEFQALSEAKRRQGATLSLRYRITHGWLMDRWLGLSCRRSNRVLYLNSDEGRLLVERGWARPEQVTRVVHGVPASGHVHNRRYPATARRLLVVSQWIERKGIDDIVQAFTTLVRDGRDLELVCAGTRAETDQVLGAFPDDVRSRVTNVAAAPNERLLAEYRTADVFVHAPLLEGLSRAQTEAMAAGLPIVTTRCGAAIDFLLDGESCLLVPMHDAAALTAAIGRLLDDAPLRERLGRAAAAIAARDMNLDRTLDALVAVYESVARRTERRAG